MRLGERASNGIVLAREPAYHHVDGGKLPLSGLDLVKNLVDIFVYDGVLSEVRLVAASGELASLGSGRLPLVGPDGLEGACGGHIELGVRGVMVAVEAKTKPADPREELGYFNILGHVSPIATVSHGVNPSRLLDLENMGKIETASGTPITDVRSLRHNADSNYSRPAIFRAVSSLR